MQVQKSLASFFKTSNKLTFNLFKRHFLQKKMNKSEVSCKNHIQESFISCTFCKIIAILALLEKFLHFSVLFQDSCNILQEWCKFLQDLARKIARNLQLSSERLTRIAHSIFFMAQLVSQIWNVATILLTYISSRKKSVAKTGIFSWVGCGRRMVCKPGAQLINDYW